MPAVVTYIVGAAIFLWYAKEENKPNVKWWEEQGDSLDVLKDYLDRIFKDIDLHIGTVLDVIALISQQIGGGALKVLTEKLTEYTILLRAIAAGDTAAIILAISGVYDGMVASIGDLTDFILIKLDDTWEHIDDAKEDVLKIVDKKIQDILDPESEFMRAIADATGDVLDILYSEITISVKNIMSEVDIKIDVIEGEVGKIRYQSEDLEHFSKMFTELMES